LKAAICLQDLILPMQYPQLQVGKRQGKLGLLGFGMEGCGAASQPKWNQSLTQNCSSIGGWFIPVPSGRVRLQLSHLARRS
jgi:hypothetical protein